MALSLIREYRNAFGVSFSFRSSRRFVKKLAHMKSLLGKERGFSLIELLAVIKKHLCVSIVSALALSVPGMIRAQNLFVADQGSINEYTPAGAPSTFASGLNSALGLTFNNAGDLFVAENYVGGNIYEYTPNGIRSTFATGLYYPLGLAFNSAGNLFVTEDNGYIYEFTPNGMRSTFASGVNTPTGLAFNTAGNLFAADQRDGLIYEYTPDGMRSTFATGLTNPNGLAFDSAGNLFVASGGGSIYEYTPNGMRSTFAQGLIFPEGLAFDGSGNLFVTDGATIYEYRPGGGRTTFASTVGPAFAPWGLAFQVVPEPPALALLTIGGAALLVIGRKIRWL